MERSPWRSENSDEIGVGEQGVFKFWSRAQFLSNPAMDVVDSHPSPSCR
jgi:hypothetical protein